MAASMGAQMNLGVDASSTTSTERYEFTSLSLNINEELLDSNGIRGSRSHASERVRQGTRAPGYTLTLQPNAVELDAWLPRILGGAESTDAFPLAETLPTFVTNIDAVAKRIHLTGCKVNRAVFSGAQGQPLELTLEVEALDLSFTDTVFTAGLSISTVGPFIFSDLVASIASTAYSWRSVRLTIDNALDTGRFFNSQTRSSLPEQDRTITWELDGPYGDNAAIYGLTSAGVAVVSTWTLGNRSLAFTSNKVATPKMGPQFNGREEIMLPWVGIARMDGSTRELTTVCDSSG